MLGYNTFFLIWDVLVNRGFEKLMNLNVGRYQRAIVLGRHGRLILIVESIYIKMDQPLIGQLEVYFKKMISELSRLKRMLGLFPGQIVFRGGGTLPIPDWFREFCEENGIEIIIVDDHDLANVGRILERESLEEDTEGLLMRDVIRRLEIE